MSDRISLSINGKKTDIPFTRISVTKRLDSLCGTFSFTMTANDRNFQPVKMSDKCNVYINDVKVITGFIEELNTSYEAKQLTISATGKDKTCDIIDSYLYPKEYNANTRLDIIIRRVIEELGISGMDVILSGVSISDISFSLDESVSRKVDESAFEFIERYARKKQVFLRTNNDGNVVVYRSNRSDKPIAKIIHKIGDISRNNVLSVSENFSRANRHYKTIVISQENTNPSILQNFTDISDQNISLVEGESLDNRIRRTRIRVVESKTSSDAASCRKQAHWESNVRRARSYKYLPTMFGFTYDGVNIWQINQVVEVYDDFLDVKYKVPEEKMRLNSVTYNYSINEGATTELECVFKDAYNLEAEEDDYKKQKDVNESKKIINDYSDYISSKLGAV